MCVFVRLIVLVGLKGSIWEQSSKCVVDVNLISYVKLDPGSAEERSMEDPLLHNMFRTSKRTLLDICQRTYQRLI